MSGIESETNLTDCSGAVGNLAGRSRFFENGGKSFTEPLVLEQQQIYFVSVDPVPFGPQGFHGQRHECAGEGNDMVQDFAAGPGSEDVLDVSGLGYLDLASVLADTVQDGADALIQTSGGENITLVGVDQATLHQDDFIFA